MITIGILGASSQVGSSVALYLKKFPDIRVICFIRSTYSQVFFDLFGIDCLKADTSDELAMKEAFASIDVVLDFRYPAVQMHEILDRSKQDIEKTLKTMKTGSTYFYMSSIMAYGMPENEKWIGNYRIPRTSYAYIKRALETFTEKKGRLAGIRIYNFRLGQVHGFLQSVNTSFRKKLALSNVALIDGEPQDPVNVIFIYPLCEAIVSCIKGSHQPGLYTLVSDPQWTLQELYGYYNKEYNQEAAALEFRPAGTGGRRSMLQRLIALARPYRSLVETYLLMRFPSLAVSMKGRFRQSELSGQSSRVPDGLEYIDYNLLGAPPLRMIPGLTADPASTLAMEKEMEEYYTSVITAAQHV